MRLTRVEIADLKVKLFAKSAENILGTICDGEGACLSSRVVRLAAKKQYLRECLVDAPNS